jgi:hypothetical protein
VQSSLEHLFYLSSSPKGLMDWEMGPAVDQELPTIIGDAITGKQAAAKRLHVDGLRNSVTERAMRAHHPSADKAIQDPRRARSGEGDR